MRRSTSWQQCCRWLTRSHNLEQLGSVLFSLHRGTPRHGEWVIACLAGAWSRLIGDRLAAACRPVRLKDSTLTIEVLDINWVAAVNSVKPELMEKLQTVTAGEVKSISVVSG
jgi:hypothetical protein